MSVRDQEHLPGEEGYRALSMSGRGHGGAKVVSQAGGVLLTETVRGVGLDRALSAELVRWRHPNAVHDPAKIVLDLAVTLALGGNCLADIPLLRAEPDLFGRVPGRCRR
jgi:Transposase DDE domain group 1